MTPEELNPPMNARGLNRIFAVAPVVCSAIALALVLGNVAAGVPRQADEGTAAHLFQLLIAIQLPLVIAFIATADWRRPVRPAMVLGMQALAGAAALGALAWSGY
jgi:hypothetical protein